MKVVQEVTDWDAPNHVYFLNDSRDRMYAYINSTGIVQEVTSPYPFHTRGRKFREIENQWGFEPREHTTGREFRAAGSRGSVYVVSEESGRWSCTCPAAKYQAGPCKHITSVRDQATG